MADSATHPRTRTRWPLVILGVLAAAGVAWLVIGLVLARFAAEPMGEVVRAIGRLEPFTHELPNGSVVVLGSDTVGVLDSFVQTETLGGAGENLILVKGRWVGGAGQQLGRDTALVGRIASAIDSAAPLIVTLDTSATMALTESVGVVSLEPGEGIIRLRRN